MFTIEIDKLHVDRVLGTFVKLGKKWEEWQGDIRVDAEKYKQSLIEAILTQKYPWDPYSDSYRERKFREGRDMRKWLYTWAVFDDINSIQTKRISVGNYTVQGTLPGYVKYAEGRRPLFRPVYEETYMAFSTKFKRWKKETENIFRQGAK